MVSQQIRAFSFLGSALAEPALLSVVLQHIVESPAMPGIAPRLALVYPVDPWLALACYKFRQNQPFQNKLLLHLEDQNTLVGLLEPGNKQSHRHLYCLWQDLQGGPCPPDDQAVAIRASFSARDQSLFRSCD